MIESDKYISVWHLEDCLIDHLDNFPRFKKKIDMKKWTSECEDLRWHNRVQLDVLSKEDILNMVFRTIETLGKCCGTEPPRQGIWVMKDGAYTCGVCGCESPASMSKYCCNCGAMMYTDKILVNNNVEYV